MENIQLLIGAIMILVLFICLKKRPLMEGLDEHLELAYMEDADGNIKETVIRLPPGKTPWSFRGIPRSETNCRWVSSGEFFNKFGFEKPSYMKMWRSCIPLLFRFNDPIAKYIEPTLFGDDIVILAHKESPWTYRGYSGRTGSGCEKVYSKRFKRLTGLKRPFDNAWEKCKPVIYHGNYDSQAKTAELRPIELGGYMRDNEVKIYSNTDSPGKFLDRGCTKVYDHPKTFISNAQRVKGCDAEPRFVEVVSTGNLEPTSKPVFLVPHTSHPSVAGVRTCNNVTNDPAFKLPDKTLGKNTKLFKCSPPSVTL